MSLDRAIEAATKALQNAPAADMELWSNMARIAVEAAAPHIAMAVCPLCNDDGADHWRERAERVEAEVKTAIEWVGEVLIQRNAERALADELAEALRDMVRPGSAMFQERIRKANDALDKWEEARK